MIIHQSCQTFYYNKDGIKEKYQLLSLKNTEWHHLYYINTAYTKTKLLQLYLHLLLHLNMI